jgi:hypothetical protein
MTNARPEQVGTGAVVIEPGRQSHDTAELGHLAHVLPLVLPWARVYIENAAGAEIPEYGTSAFHALEDGPLKVASCVVAAERWRTRRLQGAAESAYPRRAREIAEARRPRPGDHPGGPVPWIRADVR